MTPWLKIVVETAAFHLEVTDGYAVALICFVMAVTIALMGIVLKEVPHE